MIPARRRIQSVVTKRCSVCGDDRLLTKFRLLATGKRKASCKRCDQRSLVEYHHSARGRAIQVARRRRIRVAVKQRLLDVLGVVGCSCGETHIACLDFHHTNDNKDGEISSMIRQVTSFSRILTEAKKCEVLCANCHRKTHYKQ